MSERILNHLSAADPNLGGVIREVGKYGLELDTECHPFQALAEAIAHQQLHKAAARNILTRFVDNIGRGTFPTPEAVLAAPEDALRAVGFSLSKIAALRDLASKTLDGVVPDRETLARLEDAEIIERLTEVRGIGRWTVEMLLMFHLGRPDVLPVDDFGVRAGFQFTYGLRKMPAPKVLALYGERWAPYRSAAAWFLWRAVELKRAGKLPKPVEQVRLPRVSKPRRRTPKKVRLTAPGKDLARKVAAAARAAGLKGLSSRPASSRPAASGLATSKPKKAKSKRAYK